MGEVSWSGASCCWKRQRCDPRQENHTHPHSGQKRVLFVCLFGWFVGWLVLQAYRSSEREARASCTSWHRNVFFSDWGVTTINMPPLLPSPSPFATITTAGGTQLQLPPLSVKHILYMQTCFFKGQRSRGLLCTLGVLEKYLYLYPLQKSCEWISFRVSKSFAFGHLQVKVGVQTKAWLWFALFPSIPEKCGTILF